VARACEGLVDEPDAEEVDGCEEVADGLVGEDAITEDIKDVVTVVGEGKRVNYCVVFDDQEGEREGESGGEDV
jgi:hypothetical protein